MTATPRPEQSPDERPGAPGSVPPPVVPPPAAERTMPPPKPDQTAPEPVTATGVRTTATDGPPPERARGQQGDRLTTAGGTRLRDTDHSLKAGPRGPVLLQDHHLREKIMHFDHERIPERAVHARGAGAHGVFRAYGTAASVTRAAFLAKDVETPVFVRFSTVVGSRGSADTVRDTRGFATKFYTSEGVFDLVGNNFPVFFIQDAIKFPDIVHAAKPHPDREIPQAQSAHDTFWDFVSLHTEAQHHVIWQMSDRAIPRSYRMMEGFGIHTFRLVDADGGTTLVKFHWKPVLGAHSLVWEEAQMLAGMDPDYHRRDLGDAIEAGAFPEWELGIQVFPDTPEQTFEGIDLLDPTKIVPEELAPVQRIGRLTLNGNPTNYFAETEQVAFHPGHLVPGIDVTDDPLLQGRLFSYLDTQLTRLGGPNFPQIPVNRSHAPVNDMLRDGFHQHAVHEGVAPYQPNSLDGGVPVPGEELDATDVLVEVPTAVSGAKVRQAPASFADHLSQVRLFWLSLTPVEQQHVVDAYAFELGKCYEQSIRERQLAVLARVDTDLCARVAALLGLPAPDADGPLPHAEPSPALRQVGERWPTSGRQVAVVVLPGADVDQVASVRDAVDAAGMVPHVVAPTGGEVDGGGTTVTAQRSYATARSVEFDAVLVAGAAPGTGGDELDPRVVLFLSEAYRHGKALGGWGDAERALGASAVPTAGPGVVVGEDAEAVLAEVATLMAEHRVWDRMPPLFTAP
ncbi:catalase [Thalassiella azotivora]